MLLLKIKSITDHCAKKVTVQTRLKVDNGIVKWILTLKFCIKKYLIFNMEWIPKMHGLQIESCNKFSLNMDSVVRILHNRGVRLTHKGTNYNNRLLLVLFTIQFTKNNNKCLSTSYFDLILLRWTRKSSSLLK